VFFKKFDFDPDPEPDPELSEKSDPEIIFSDPTHWFLYSTYMGKAFCYTVCCRKYCNASRGQMEIIKIFLGCNMKGFLQRD